MVSVIEGLHCIIKKLLLLILLPLLPLHWTCLMVFQNGSHSRVRWLLGAFAGTVVLYKPCPQATLIFKNRVHIMY